MFGQPLSCAVLLEMPPVNDIAVEDEAVAVDAAEEISDFPYFGVGSAEMDVRQDYRAVVFA